MPPAVDNSLVRFALPGRDGRTQLHMVAVRTCAQKTQAKQYVYSRLGSWWGHLQILGCDTVEKGRCKLLYGTGTNQLRQRPDMAFK